MCDAMCSPPGTGDLREIGVCGYRRRSVGLIGWSGDVESILNFDYDLLCCSRTSCYLHRYPRRCDWTADSICLYN